MHRRDFLKTGVQAAAVGAAVSLPASSGLAAAGSGRLRPTHAGHFEELYGGGPPAATAKHRRLPTRDSQRACASTW